MAARGQPPQPPTTLRQLHQPISSGPQFPHQRAHYAHRPRLGDDQRRSARVARSDFAQRGRSVQRHPRLPEQRGGFPFSARITGPIRCRVTSQRRVPGSHTPPARCRMWASSCGQRTATMRPNSANSTGPMRAARGGGERTDDPGHERRAGTIVRMSLQRLRRALLAVTLFRTRRDIPEAERIWDERVCHRRLVPSGIAWRTAKGGRAHHRMPSVSPIRCGGSRCPSPGRLDGVPANQRRAGDHHMRR